MARETVILNSGDLLFSLSEGGCNSLLPVDRKLWLNDQIIDMYHAIEDLQKGQGSAGKDGRDVVMRVGPFPEGQPDIPENYALMWRIQPRQGEVETPWQVLLRYSDMKGEQGPIGPAGEEGPEGPPGKMGTSVKFKGTVDTVSHLLDLTNLEIGDGFLVTERGTLFVLRAQPPAYLGSWADMGKILGPQGPRGPQGKQGPRGSKGEQGAAGAISMFIIQWMVNAATSAAISGAMTEVSSMINDAINDAINQMMSEMENMVTDAVEKAVSDALEDIKGEKGDKGDDGEKGDDGKSIRMVGKYDTLTQFTVKYPADKDNVGTGALIGKDGEEKVLWAITETPGIGSLPAHYTYEEMGDIRGPKGEPAKWSISVRDKDFVAKGDEIDVDSDLPTGVASMYIQETSSILIEGVKGSQVNAKQVGLKLSMKYPIPTLVKEGDAVGTPTAGKVLGNNGEKLEWVDGGSGGSKTEDEVLLKGEDGRIWALSIDDDGRLHQDLSIETTDTDMIKLKSPSGAKWGITIARGGKMIISEVI
ncbi:MAG: collagen-like triple helix repeat-containing protein [Bacteroidales bacterium]